VPILRCLYHPHMASGAAPHVLVVEDDHLVRTYLRFALQRGGMSVSEAADGGDALRVVTQTKVDAMLVDGLLPDMHGVALAAQLLDDPSTSQVPICFLSGAVHSRRDAQAGIGCLVKPVRPAQLLAHVHTLLAWTEGGGSPVDERREVLRRLENGFLVGP
jgi:two-component system, OmpR family, response regulator